MPGKVIILLLLLSLLGVPLLFAGEGGREVDDGRIVTLWPLLDYRESPQEGYWNLSLLGPLFKFQVKGDEQDVALRPFFYNTSNRKEKTATTTYLYPVAASEDSPQSSTIQVLSLYQKYSYRKDEEGKQEKGAMLFPFYISGSSEKYGPYTSVFPLYGDIYERFWRDEYHYALFPLYGSTVKKGTTTRNYLYPFFSTISGDRESGFQFWPLYGQSAKEGVYSKHFFIWPFIFSEESGLNTDNPTDKLYILPLYAATDSPQKTSRYYLWPFIGHAVDRKENWQEWDYFWPFVRTVRGDKRNVSSFLPLYSSEKNKEDSKRWLMWPLFMHEEMYSADFQQKRDRVFYFLYSDRREYWPKDGTERRKVSLWPLFVYNRDHRGVRAFSFPAPVEPIFDREGIEKSWAPFWRIYQQRWDVKGDSAASLLWNLYWHERRGDEFACELFPLLSYRSGKKSTDSKLFKGLVRYRNHDGQKTLGLFWLPYAFNWGEKMAAAKPVAEIHGSQP